MYKNCGQLYLDYSNPNTWSYKKITQRAETRRSLNCNENGYGDPGTLKGMLSIYSDLIGKYNNGKHIYGNTGDGGTIYLEMIYKDEYDIKCGYHEDGRVGPGGHTKDDLITEQERADYTAWLYENQLEYWQSIFGDYGSLENLGDEENIPAGSLELEYNNWNKNVNNNTRTLINYAKSQMGKKASDFGWNDEWCAYFISKMFNDKGFTDVTGGNKNIAAVQGYRNLANSKNLLRSKDNYKPKAGDICICQGTNEVGGSVSHVMLVYACDDTRVYFIEGNSGSGKNWSERQVQSSSLPLNSSRITSYYASSELLK